MIAFVFSKRNIPSKDIISQTIEFPQPFFSYYIQNEEAANKNEVIDFNETPEEQAAAEAKRLLQEQEAQGAQGAAKTKLNEMDALDKLLSTMKTPSPAPNRRVPTIPRAPRQYDGVPRPQPSGEVYPLRRTGQYSGRTRPSTTGTSGERGRSTGRRMKPFDARPNTSAINAAPSVLKKTGVQESKSGGRRKKKTKRRKRKHKKKTRRKNKKKRRKKTKRRRKKKKKTRRRR